MSASASVIVTIALLAAFLILITIFKYAIADQFLRTRLMMSAFFLFVLSTLTISFGPSAMITLPFSIPAFVVGMGLGYFIGVRTERQKIVAEGIERYMDHFSRIEPEDVQRLTWWSIVNFYSVMGGLILVNLIGFTNIILSGSPTFIIITSAVGAVFVGSIVPYLGHLWSIPLTRRS